MKRLFYSVLFLTLLAASLFGTWRTWKSWKRSQRHKRAFSEASLVHCSETSKHQKADDTLHALLQQPYFFLAHGRQSYAFMSMDGKYVLKFFKQSSSSASQSGLPDLFIFNYFKKKAIKEKQQKMRHLARSQVLAVMDLTEETGVEYVHMKRCGLPERVMLLDPKGEVLYVDIDHLQFIVQRAIAPLKETFIRLMQENRVEEAKKRVHAIFDLLEHCRKKKIWDRDTGLIRNGNIGFLHEKAVYIDTGKLAPFKRGMDYTAYDLKRLRPLGKWFNSYYPSLAVEFEKRYTESSATILESKQNLQQYQ